MRGVRTFEFSYILRNHVVWHEQKTWQLPAWQSISMYCRTFVSISLHAQLFFAYCQSPVTHKTKWKCLFKEIIPENWHQLPNCNNHIHVFFFACLFSLRHWFILTFNTVKFVLTTNKRWKRWNLKCIINLWSIF